MDSNEDNHDGIRIKLLQEMVWSNGDKLNGILEHLVALENELIKIRRSLERSVSK